MTDYVPPSQCDRCVPTETITNQSAITWAIESAHQTSCPNHPANTGGPQ